MDGRNVAIDMSMFQPTPIPFWDGILCIAIALAGIFAVYYAFASLNSLLTRSDR